MKFKDKVLAKINELKQSQKAGVAIGLSMVSSGAFASTTGTEFSALATKIEGWTNGYLGVAMSLVALLFGVVSGIFKGTLVGVGIGIGAALCFTVGVTVIKAMFTAVI